jgi:hypothetical protein
MDELFTTLTRIIAHPHTAITDHDRIRAAKAIIEVSYFYLGYCTDDAPDLYRYATELLGELESHGAPS